MHEDRHAGARQHPHQRRDMVLMAVHAAGRQQAHHMDRALARLRLGDDVEQRGALRETAVLDGEIDARQILAHDAAGADVHMPDLGVSHLPGGQADGMAGGRQQGMRTLGQQARVVRRLGFRDRVVGRIGPPAPAVEDAQHRGMRTGQVRGGG